MFSVLPVCCPTWWFLLWACCVSPLHGDCEVAYYNPRCTPLLFVLVIWVWFTWIWPILSGPPVPILSVSPSPIGPSLLVQDTHVNPAVAGLAAAHSEGMRALAIFCRPWGGEAWVHGAVLDMVLPLTTVGGQAAGTPIYTLYLQPEHLIRLTCSNVSSENTVQKDGGPLIH